MKNATIQLSVDKKWSIIDMAWKKNKCNRKCFIDLLKPMTQLSSMDINEILVKPMVQ